jgi:hypothetical protein
MFQDITANILKKTGGANSFLPVNEQDVQGQDAQVQPTVAPPVNTGAQAVQPAVNQPQATASPQTAAPVTTPVATPATASVAPVTAPIAQTGGTNAQQQANPPTSRIEPEKLYLDSAGKAAAQPGYIDPVKPYLDSEGNVKYRNPGVKYPDKPNVLSDSEYERMIAGGLSPEAISSTFNVKPYDPSKNVGFLENIYKASMPAPAAVDEKKVRTAKLISGVGDALGLLGQLFTASRGAHVRDRDFKSSALGQTLERENAMRKLYLQRMTNYNTGLNRARTEDYIRGANEYSAQQKAVRDALENIRKSDATAAKNAADMAYKKAILDGKDKDRALKESQAAERKELDRLKFEETQRHNKKTEGISGMNAQTSRMRANTSGSKSASGGTTKSVPLFFDDGDRIDVPESVWKANQPALIKELENAGANVPYEWISGGKQPTAAQMDAFVKQHKDRLSPQTRKWLKNISDGIASKRGEQGAPAAQPAEQQPSPQPTFDMNSLLPRYNVQGANMPSGGTGSKYDSPKYRTNHQ